jgi:hypothetical protein
MASRLCVKNLCLLKRLKAASIGCRDNSTLRYGEGAFHPIRSPREAKPKPLLILPGVNLVAFHVLLPPLVAQDAIERRHFP